MPKPTIILIPGGYNNPGPTPTVDIPIYKNFNDALRNEGFPVVSVPYPSLIRSNPAQCTCAQDVDFIRNEVLLPKVERGEHVVLVMHSYGSIPACGAAKGLSTVERRREGKKGGVLGLVCVSAFLLPPGTSIAGECPGGDLPYWVRQNEPAAGLAIIADPLGRFCYEAEGNKAKLFEAQIAPHAVIAFKSPSPAPAWLDDGWRGRLAYIICTEDCAIPMPLQESMMNDTGKVWLRRKLEGSHFAPFLLRHAEAAAMVKSFIQAFEKAEEESTE